MKIFDCFPSNWLKASDLQGRTITVTINCVRLEVVGDGDKPVIYFQGTEKGAVLNKTNSNNIALLYGDETDGWAGKQVALYPAMVDFQGHSVEAIRIKGPPVARNGQQRPAAPAPPRPRLADYAAFAESNFAGDIVLDVADGFDRQTGEIRP